jgi:hypothetical protein
MDYGDAFWDDSAGVAYHKNATNPVCHAADTTIGAGDVINISSVTFARDNTSPFASSWSACEVAVASNKNDCVGSFSGDGATSRLFEAPSDGEVRIWTTQGGGSPFIFVNGIYVKRLADASHSLAGGTALRLELGDTVDIYGSNDDTDYLGSGYAYAANFRPDVYP